MKKILKMIAFATAYNAFDVNVSLYESLYKYKNETTLNSKNQHLKNAEK